MELKTYIVVYFPFVSSDVTSSCKMTGKNEDDVRREFRATYQVAQIKSITEE